MKKYKKEMSSSRLTDTDIVSSLILQNYNNPSICFTKVFNKNTSRVICHIDGVNKYLKVICNPYKHKKSSNFLFLFNKNSLNKCTNTLYAFHDEVTSSIYLMHGDSLLNYITENIDSVCQSEKSQNHFFILIPKSTLCMKANDVVKYISPDNVF